MISQDEFERQQLLFECAYPLAKGVKRCNTSSGYVDHEIDRIWRVWCACYLVNVIKRDMQTYLDWPTANGYWRVNIDGNKLCGLIENLSDDECTFDGSQLYPDMGIKFIRATAPVFSSEKS